MEIERIDSYTDVRFEQEVLFQHGGFIVDGKYPCAFKITGMNTAVVDYHDYESVLPVIERFRFYSEHITDFYDKSGNCIAKFPAVLLKELPIEELQPSQFYADEDKVSAVSRFVKSKQDVIIPVIFDKNMQRYISLDGHTRMYYAYSHGFKSVYIFESESDIDIYGFVSEAQKRGVTKISDIKLLPHKQYEICWNKFCDDYFAQK